MVSLAHNSNHFLWWSSMQQLKMSILQDQMTQSGFVVEINGIFSDMIKVILSKTPYYL